MAVEVHHMIGAARIRGPVKHLGQPRERSRAQHLQVQPGHPLGAAADQPGGHRPERHILRAAGSADHQQHPQLIPGRLRQDHLPGGLQVGPDELARPGRQRDIRAGVAQQLPRQARRLSRVGIDLHPHLGEPTLGQPPDHRPVPGGKHLLEQLRAGLGQPGLGRGRQRRGRIGGELRVVLQVPADLLGLPPVGLIAERGHRRPPGRPVLPGHLHPPRLAQRNVADPQHRHRPHPHRLISHSGLATPQNPGIS